MTFGVDSYLSLGSALEFFDISGGWRIGTELGALVGSHRTSTETEKLEIALICFHLLFHPSRPFRMAMDMACASAVFSTTPLCLGIVSKRLVARNVHILSELLI
jgi:hypothetical protein